MDATNHCNAKLTPRVSTARVSQQVLHILIIEEHTEALECLSLAARRSIIPLQQCSMIHFDAHPDMSCLESIKYEHIHNRTKLCHMLRNSVDGISTFILPAIAQGLVKNVTWIKPKWSHQIPTGTYDKLLFGWTKKRGRSGNKMCVCTSLPYWKEDGVAVDDPRSLKHAVTFDLSVTHIDDWVKLSPILSTDQDGQPTPWILDVCLDYFSCDNPMQDSEQPEHISSKTEIAASIELFRFALLQVQSSPPSICIIARSEHDGFTPTNIASELEEMVVGVIDSVFRTKDKGITVTAIDNYEQFYDPNFIRLF